MNKDNNLEQTIQEYGNIIYRTSYVMVGNEHDAQDIMQETFIRYMKKAPVFREKEHEKAWLLTVVHNLCIDMLRFRKRHLYVNLDEVDTVSRAQDENKVIKAILLLPAKYKMVLLLYYVEGFKVSEISRMIRISESAVKKRMQRGRELLRVRMEDV